MKDIFVAVAGRLAVVIKGDPVVFATVRISSPEDSTFTVGDSITFVGTASATEDLTDGLVWTSNLDDEIGTGGSFSISTLTKGSHTITASVDSGSVTGSDSIDVTITPVGSSPVLAVSPSSLAFGNTVTGKSFGITNTGGGTLNWGIVTDQEWLVDTQQFQSKGKNTPLQGTLLRGKVVATLVEGRPVFHDGRIENDG